MEAYKTTCPDCGHVHRWIGFKTGFGKSPAQLQRMEEEEKTCVHCGSKNADTDLDRESEAGQAYGESGTCLARMIAEPIKIVPTMLDALQKTEAKLPELLRDESCWNSLFINYHPPLVERLWRQDEERRISLHRIHPCQPNEALFHPHPWPSAIRVIEGTYEMAIGYGIGDIPPPIAATLILSPGSAYEMVHPNGWHWVRPLKQPSLSVMVTGVPWKRSAPSSEREMKPLSMEQRYRLLNSFRLHYL